MARGRMVNHSISESRKFHLLPDDTCRLLATWIISRLDFRGVFRGDAVMVKSIIFPRRGDITNEQVEDCLRAMEDIGLIYRFEAKGDVWQCWPGFADNQAGLRADRETTNYPIPPDYTPPTPKSKTANGPQDDSELPAPIPQESGDNPTESQQDAAEMTAEDKLSKGKDQAKRNQVNTEDEKAVPAPPSTFADWLKLVHESKNRPATLRFMHEHLFPGRDPPDYGYIGRTAKIVGGAGRLAELFWQASSKPPTGDVLRYAQGMAKGQRRDQEPVGLDALALLIQEEAEIGDT